MEPAYVSDVTSRGIMVLPISSGCKQPSGAKEHTPNVGLIFLRSVNTISSFKVDDVRSKRSKVLSIIHNSKAYNGGWSQESHY